MNQELEAGEITVEHSGNWLLRAWGVIATVLSVLYTAILAIPTFAVCFFAGGHWVTPFTRLWAWLIIRTCGIGVEVEGLEHLDGLGQVVLVSNHKSLLDIVAMVYATPRELRFVAKRELKRIPLIGVIMERGQHIIIDRQTGGRTIRRALEVSRLGYSFCVFAEGHRFNDGLVHEFSDGAAWLAIATGLPCVPVTISGSLALMPRGSRFVIPGRRIRIKLGQAIATAGLRSKDRIELTRRLEAEVRASFQIRLP